MMQLNQTPNGLLLSTRYHARIKEFLPGGGGGGVQARLPENSPADNVSFSPQLILQFYSGLSMVYFTENCNFPRFQRGSNISRMGLMAILYRNP